MTVNPIVVIGIGHEGAAGLSAEAQAHIDAAEVLVGGKRHLEFFPDWTGETIVIDAALDRLVRQLEAAAHDRKTVVLASGDPLFYGIGRALSMHFPPQSIYFIPQVSSIQLAFARLKTSWHDAQIVSLHGRPMQTLLPALSSGASKIALFTDRTNHPAAIAQYLIDAGCGTHYELWVCEELGGPKERVTHWTPTCIAAQEFSALNIVVLLRCEAPSNADEPALPLLGLPENRIAHRDGMITKRELRLLALGYLQLQAGDVLWDVGAGSGSVAVEAARLSPSLQIFAIEKDETSIAHIVTNVGNFAVPHVQPVHGEAPEAFADLAAPHAVFIGGSGGRIAAIIPAVAERLHPGGRVVMNCITLEHFTLGWELLKNHGFRTDVTSVQLSHSQPLGPFHRFASDSPIFIVQAQHL